MNSQGRGKLSDQKRKTPRSAEPLAHDQERFWRIAIGLVSGRVRLRALLELLEGKGVLVPGEFDSRAQGVWERDYQALADELLSPSNEAEEEPGALAPPPATKPGESKEHAATVLQSFISEAVASRVRLRAVVELLEEKRILQPGEFEARAAAVWDRDYEELTREFYKMNF